MIRKLFYVISLVLFVQFFLKKAKIFLWKNDDKIKYEKNSSLVDHFTQNVERSDNKLGNRLRKIPF